MNDTIHENDGESFTSNGSFESSMNEAHRPASNQTNSPTQVSVNGSALHQSNGFSEVQHLNRQEGATGSGKNALINRHRELRKLKLAIDQEIVDV
jgi:predicted GTPase